MTTFCYCYLAFSALLLQLAWCYVTGPKDVENEQNCETISQMVQKLNESYSIDLQDTSELILKQVEERQAWASSAQDPPICQRTTYECRVECFWFSNVFEDITLETNMLVKISKEEGCEEEWKPVVAKIAACGPEHSVVFHLPLSVTKKSS